MDLHKFTLGINYWPINKAIYWWQNFDRKEVEEDFLQLKIFNLEYIRIFLTWEDFQPEPDNISPIMLDNLITVAELAEKYELKLMPTFFCGHMSGANWMPSWMIEPNNKITRFPLYSTGKVIKGEIKNLYKLDELLAAQVLQISSVCQALKGQTSICAYDLGNETSNCYIPTTHEEGQQWLKILTNTVKDNSSLPVTYGMHAEDLEENRNIWPQDVAKYCDFVVMHGYPFYLNWANHPLDVFILPFLGIITKWLANKPVLFQEFGAPSIPTIPPYLATYDKANLKCPLWTEAEVKLYYEKAIHLLYEAGMIGAWAWCYGDYAPHLWDKTPLKENYHERYFGLFRHDKNPKLQTKVFRDFHKSPIKAVHNEPEWLQPFQRDNFYQNPLHNLQVMYKAYTNYLKNKENN